MGLAQGADVGWAGQLSANAAPADTLYTPDMKINGTVHHVFSGAY